jgi:DNA invertase Pin-like site-specific DNA recombinase
LRALSPVRGCFDSNIGLCSHVGMSGNASKPRPRPVSTRADKASRVTPASSPGQAPLTGAKKAPTGIIYCRVSSRAQAKGDNIAEQLPACEKIATRHEIKVLRSVGTKGSLQDNGVSGTLLEGRKLSWLLDQLESGALQFDFIIVRDLARVLRPDLDLEGVDRDKHIQQSLYDEARIKGVLLRRGVRIIDERNIYDPGEPLMWSLYTGLQSADLQNRRRALTGGKRHRLIAEGRYVWGYTPFGYRRTYRPDGSYFIEEDSERSRQLRQLFAWIIEGGYAYACRQAERARFRSASADNKPDTTRTGRKQQWHGTSWNEHKWHRATLRRLVRRAHCYATGKWDYEWRGESAVVELPKLIDHRLYLAVKRVAEKRAPKTTAQVRLTTGMLACGKCGGLYAYNNNRQRRIGYIRCQSCQRQHRYDMIEPALWRIALLRLAEMITANLSPATTDFSKRQESVRERLQGITARQTKLYDTYERNLIEGGEYERRFRSLKLEASRLRAELVQIESEQRAALDSQQTRGTIEERARELIGAPDRLTISSELRRERDTLLVVTGGVRATVTEVRGLLAIAMPAVGALPARKYKLVVDELTQAVNLAYSSHIFGFRALPKESLEGDGSTMDSWEVDIDLPSEVPSKSVQQLRKKVKRRGAGRKLEPTELPEGDVVVIDRKAADVRPR